MKYRKKPIVIEARQWAGTTEGANKLCHWINGIDENPTDFNRTASFDYVAREVTRFDIKTLEGVYRVSKYDFIIKGIKGEFYPCKPDIFEATYEKVE